MNRKHLIINFICILIAGFTVTGFAADRKPSVAVLDFESMGTEDYLGKAVSEIMRTALVNNQNYKVVERAQISKALSEQKFQKSGIIDDKSAVEIGKLVGADLIIVGSVVKIGNAYTINSRMIEVKTGEAKLGQNVTATDLNLLTSMSNELVENLFGIENKQIKQKYSADKKVVMSRAVQEGDIKAIRAWKSMRGQGKDVAVSESGGTAWAIGPDSGIYFNSGGGWQQYPGEGRGMAISVSSEGTPFVIGMDNGIYKGTGSGWIQLPGGGKGKDIAIDRRGNAWVIGTDLGIYYHNGSYWTQYPGNGKGLAITVTGDGVPFVIGIDNGVYRGTGSGWIQLPGGGKGKDIAIDGRGNAWVIGMDDFIYYHDGVSWSQLPGGGHGQRIAVNNSGTPMVIGLDYAIWRFD